MAKARFAKRFSAEGERVSKRLIPAPLIATIESLPTWIRLDEKRSSISAIYVLMNAPLRMFMKKATQ
jgi:hypothetical protein